MKKVIQFIIPLFILTSLLIISGCGCKKNTGPQYKLNLEIWGSVDDSYTLRDIFDNYIKINPQIGSIEYKKLSVDTYKKEVTDALASGQGPDIFLINNTWLPSFSDKIVPAASEIINEQKLRKDFVDVVTDDFLDKGQVWALPLTVDSLGLYYNKDLFNSAGITTPPKTWEEFVDDVGRLTKIDGSGEIVRAGAAIGTAYNINRSTDVLGMLMLQSGTQMIDGYGKSDLGASKDVNGYPVSPGRNALTFYTEFAKSGSAKYSWNPKMHYSIDAFSEGIAAMMFNYSWHVSTIKEKAPKINFAIAPVPQFPGSLPVNYANYWAYAVAKNKIPSIVQNSPAVSNDTRAMEAWKLITFLTTKSETPIVIKGGLGVGQGSMGYDPAVEYMKVTGKPAARRDLIEIQKTDPVVGVFAKDNLIAKSWRQADPEAIEAILAEMINQVNIGQEKVSDALNIASQRISKLSGF